LKEDTVEYQGRRDAQAQTVPLPGILDWLGAKLSA
jgi:hypothetical protein